MSDEDFPGEEPNPLIGIFAKFGLSIDSLSAQIQRSNDLEQRRLRALPRAISVEKQTGTTVTDIIDFGKPEPGRRWEMRELGAVCPAATTGNATFYVGPYIGVAVPTSGRWNFPTLPGFETFSGSQLVVLSMQHLYCAIVGMTPGVPIGLFATFDDMPQWAQTGVAAIE